MGNMHSHDFDFIILNADTVIGWGIRSMLQQVDPFTDYFPDDDEDLRQMATGKYAGIGSVIPSPTAMSTRTSTT